MLCHRAAQSEFRERMFARGVWVLPPSAHHLTGVSTATRKFIKDVIVHNTQNIEIIANFPAIKSVTVRTRYEPCFVEHKLADTDKPVVDLSGPWPSSMAKLDLSHASLENVSRLGELTQLSTLVLPTGPSESYSPALERMTRLKTISMTLSSSNGRTLDFVRGNPDLGELIVHISRDTCGEPVLDLGPLVDAQLENLHTLEIVASSGSFAVVNLARAIIAYRTSLKVFRLVGVSLDPESLVALRALFGTLEELTISACTHLRWSSVITSLNGAISGHLKRLDIWNVQVDNIEFVRDMPKLQVLRMNQFPDTMDFSPLQTPAQLELLDHGKIYNLDEEFASQWEILAKLPSLKMLKHPPSIHCALPLQQLQTLEVISRCGKSLDLSGWTGLEVLKWVGWSLGDVVRTSPRTLVHLELLVDEQKLELSHTGEMTQLRTLCMYDSNNISVTTPGDYSFLGALTQLEVLELVEAPIGDVKVLRSATHLRRLVLKQTLVTDVSPLLSLTELEYVDLRGTKATNANVLKSMPSLKALRL
ncbi:hypothetical protein PR003_g18025 [Phytophthora rubi]|uniref:Uncharacterized protein n=1 Tax=Phytophthora rubi TaxID=129364 RepID=A0A6A3KD16_9STRA|nr:hypothetical protein PR002_g17561 [Phytophthora rubi]KAE9003537.1 hypothetical protein PR001_g17949 [Phytophthora rubi]KAE9319218.1 hypothetical protein PR003_g18025 [Phytophthora rubi]